MTRDFVRKNEESRVQLMELVARLNERAFEHPVGNGWTVSTLLCHLAFWDQRALFLLSEWQAGHFEASRLSPQAIDSINGAARVVSRAVPGSAAGRLALECAAKVDAELENISDELIERVAANGFERLLNRSLHRLEHLRKIYETLRLFPHENAGNCTNPASQASMDE
jgi:hypothetical protein